MGIFDLFSKRQKILRGEVPEVYQYDNIPNSLRVQIIHIIRDAIGINEGIGHTNQPASAYDFIHQALCREYGVFTLEEDSHRKTNEACVFNFLLHTMDFEKAIDVIELSFKYIKKYYQPYAACTTVNMTPDNAIEELNQRFKEHGIGYQFDGEEIIKVDSTYAHSEIVKPTIQLLSNKKFKGANEEYLKAHEHYRHGRNKECLTECLKAFESVMKIICKEKGWQYSETDTSKKTNSNMFSKWACAFLYTKSIYIFAKLA